MFSNYMSQFLKNILKTKLWRVHNSVQGGFIVAVKNSTVKATRGENGLFGFYLHVLIHY